MEVTSIEVMQDTNMPHEEDGSTSASAAGIGDGSVAKVKAENLEPGTNGEASHPEALHHIVGHDSETIQIGEINMQLGSKSVGRQRGRKQRGAGSLKMPEIRSSPSQPMKPYEADQSFEDNENRSSSKKHAKKTPVTTIVYDDNDPSTARRQSQRVDEEHPMGNPARRLPFAPLPPSELNIRMGTTPNQTPEKYTPTKSVATSTNLTPIQVAPSITVDETSPILSLQQSGSITAQVLMIGDEGDIESEYAEETPSVPVEYGNDEEDTIESALGKVSLELYGPDSDNDMAPEHHDSDKENVPVHEVFLPGSNSKTVKLSRGFNGRQPLQTLYSAPSPSVYQSPDIFTTPTASPQQLCKARYQVEEGRRWQMIVDTNCLLNAETLESLKQLKGIRETRLVIPNVVIRELDYLQRQEESKARSSSALQWIEACMLKTPSWVHVQSSADIVHVAKTPPMSPSIYSRGFHSCRGESEMMQPTLHDHVLVCALSQQTMPDGRVAVLTDDTALKIKALAEGLVVDTATNFTDSLLNPYSDRFIYSRSTPIRRSSGCLQERFSDGFSTPRSTISSSKWAAPIARAMSRPGTPRPTSRVNFSIWHRSQPVGLQALLAKPDQIEDSSVHSMSESQFALVIGLPH